jgi:outer membrane receptor protein involved in Fe transport
MKLVRTWLLFAVALLAFAGAATAQTTNGTISGHVSDAQGLALPGVTVNASSPNLQGVRTVVTSENGDYVLSLLPSGTYTVTFELSGFQTVSKTVALAPTQVLPLDAAMGPAAITETVNVTGRAADVLTNTTQVATNFSQDLVATLPTVRNLAAVLLMAPAVHPSGPAGAFTIAGAASFESLFLVNGVTVNENIRGQAFDVYIEDAIQETTVASDGVSAEFGRFSGGVVNVITKSGGNRFTGSFRDSLANDNWRALVVGNDTHPFPPAGTSVATDSKVNTTVPNYEYTFGGPAVKDHLWFFNAGRFQNQATGRNTIAPVNLPYTSEDQRKRVELKLTESLTSNHRVEGAFAKEFLTQVNNTFSTATSMDLASLYTRQTPLSLFTLNYNGILSPRLAVESRFSMRKFSFIGSGAPSTDLIFGTLLLDRQRGGRYWSPTFCGVCDPEKRDNDDEFVKATYFASSKGGGTHNLTFGYDTFNDKRFANNHQSGSDYRINGTTSIVRNGVIFPQWLPGPSTILQYNPIAQSSLGTNFRTHSLFANDSFRVNNHFTLNLGLRWDKNHGEDSAGNLVANDSATSPRVGVVWDPKGDGRWSVTASWARYTAAIANSIADSSSAAGNPASIQWTYNGPAINPDANAANLVDSATAIQQMFNWCVRDSRGFCTTTQPTSTSLPGVSVKIPNGLTSPNVRAYAFGVSRQIGNRATVRADYSYRDYHDFYSQRIDLSTGKVIDSFGNPADLAVVENTDALKRRYSGLTVSSTYRLSGRTDVGGNYTLSRLWGNFDGENVGSGPLSTDIFQYPEYRNISWYAPEGDLSADQRHKSIMWINYGVRGVNGLTLSLYQTIASGLPYGAVGTVDARPFVTNPGYVTPQGASSETYYFTNRDAFRTEGYSRTDFAANYSYSINTGARKLDLFVQAQVINLFNQQDLCGCGATVFNNGGTVSSNTISGTTSGQSIFTPTNSSTVTRFNPLTVTPVLGTNWNYNTTTFGTALNRFAYDSPRQFRIGFGVRF